MLFQPFETLRKIVIPDLPVHHQKMPLSGSRNLPAYSENHSPSPCSTSIPCRVFSEVWQLSWSWFWTSLVVVEAAAGVRSFCRIVHQRRGSGQRPAAHQSAEECRGSLGIETVGYFQEPALRSRDD